MFQIEKQPFLKLIGLGILVLLLGFLWGILPVRTGKVDFRAYWSASYLMAHGENFSSNHSLLQVQQELTGFNEGYAMKTWNPPWVLVWLLPLTWVNFDTAANFWLLVNIGALFFSVIQSWQILFPAESKSRKWIWFPLLAALFFPSTIVSLIFGQVNLLVLCGIVGFIAFYEQKRDIVSGLMLTLTTFKPHLVYLVLPVILLHSCRQRRWAILVSFSSFLSLSTIIVLLLRPTFLIDYIQGTVDGNLLTWEAATLVTWLSLNTGWLWIRLIAVVLLPATLLAWFTVGKNWDMMKIAQTGLLGSLITMPFGWSYDFVVLLLPILQVLTWLLTKNLARLERLIYLLILSIIYLVYFSQRIATPSEINFFWVPIAVGGLYGWVAFRFKYKGCIPDSNC